MTNYEFETPDPVQLFVELGKGALQVSAAADVTSSVTIVGETADDVHVALEGRQLSVVAPRERSGFFRSGSGVVVTIAVPPGSELAVRTSSADIAVRGPIGSSRVRTGSGDVSLDQAQGATDVETGSGDVSIGTAAAALRIKSGSGDIQIQRAEGVAAVSTGSGDIIVVSAGAALSVKSGSGDLAVTEACDDVSFTSGSGDFLVGTAHRGTITAQGASGDVVIGVPEGVPVWTDVQTVTGSLVSDLVGAGQPAEGADHLALHLRTVSGDIALRQR